jgi:pyruvate dehydrogenase (quinone)/pyruvate oxidase
LRYPVEIGLVGDAKQTLNSLIPLLNKRQKEDNEFLASKQKAMKKWESLLKEKGSRSDKPIKPQVIATAISNELDDDAIISVDSGTNTVWAARYILVHDKMKFSLSGTLATMGCGLPYAIAAKIAFPDRQSVAFVGDGGFTMLMGEFATAVQYDLPIKVVIIKNNTLGMIRWEQMAFLGNPEYAVEFTPINFARFAEDCGGKGYTITEPEDVGSIIHQALKETKPTIIEAYVDPFDPPMPPKVEPEFVKNLAESFVRGQPYASRIALTLYRNQIHERLRSLHHHNSLKDHDHKRFHKDN